MEVIDSMAKPVDLDDRDQLIQNCVTALSSKAVSHHSDLLAPMAVDAVTKIIDKETAEALVEKDATADVEVLEQSLFMLGQTLE